jgi:hypothetical protein
MGHVDEAVAKGNLADGLRRAPGGGEVHLAHQQALLGDPLHERLRLAGHEAMHMRWRETDPIGNSNDAQLRIGKIVAGVLPYPREVMPSQAFRRRPTLRKVRRRRQDRLEQGLLECIRQLGAEVVARVEDDIDQVRQESRRRVRATHSDGAHAVEVVPQAGKGILGEHQHNLVEVRLECQFVGAVARVDRQISHIEQRVSP